MCGICGWVGPGATPARLHGSIAAMVHRGPDQSGYFIAPGVMLGHRRLAILDQTDAGRQPMGNVSGSVQVLFNGEIYNFLSLRRELEVGKRRFRSGTDTEVLVHGYEEWGIEGLLARLSGMFALAIWDSDERVLHLVRDRLGKKPLFYAVKDGALAFASTLPALLKLLPSQPGVSARAIQDFLLYLCVPGEGSLMEGVMKLLPGHRAELRCGTLSIERYWDLPFGQQERRPVEEWIELLDQEILAAVKRRLVSDVPVGAFLSGGVDSSLVTAMMAKCGSRKIVTVSAGFEGDESSELPHARRVADALGTEHHEYVIRPDAAAMLPNLVFNAGEPFGDHAILPTMYLSKVAREHVGVVLTGDGGDEMFAGYPGPLLARAAAYYMKAVPVALRQHIVPAGLEALEKVRWTEAYAHRFRRLAMPARGRQFEWVYDGLGERGFRGRFGSLYTDSFRSRLQSHNSDLYWQHVWSTSDARTLADRVLATELATLLPDQFLVKTDVALMAFSLEGRSPLLDHVVAELSARIPVNVKTRGGTTKYLLKRLAALYVPRSAVYRRKQGFSPPTDRWLRGELAGAVAELLLSAQFQHRGIFDPAVVRRLVADHQEGRFNHGQRLWLLLQLELWMRMFLDGSISASDALPVGPLSATSKRRRS